MIRRALVVEDHALTADRATRLLEQAFPGLHAGVARDLRSARTHLDSADWQLALVDLSLPDGSGIDLIRQLRERATPVPALVLSVHDDDAHLFDALRAGADGYLLKEQADPQLVHQLQLWAQGQVPLSPHMARRILAHFRTGPAADEPAAATDDPGLTARETEVLACIGRGLRTHEVASRLGIAESTVTSYVKGIYNKLNINSRAEAAREAIRRGLA